MKPKYKKPTLTRFPIIDVKAYGFEPLGSCFNGVEPLSTDSCTQGGGPSGALCDMGSTDSGPGVDECTTGTGATTGCSTGWVATPCGTGSFPT